MRFDKWFTAAAVLIFPAIASADGCPGASPFTDVSASAIYCTNTEWLKNRGVTLGCGGTNYCPNDPVTRASMALFMNRLGVTMTPEVQNVYLLNDSSVNVSSTTRFCATNDFPATNYPRRSVLTAAFTGEAAAVSTLVADVVHSTDGGTNWFFTSPGVSFRVSGAGGAWANSTHSTAHAVPAGVTVRYALSLEPSPGQGGTVFARNRCFFLAQMFNANGSSSPFDAAAATMGSTNSTVNEKQ